ncbi:response regulator [Vibrio pelagius]|uniref:response regulator n=1 Tax=Vibrio pelagius TaxID=28169 RepID=UPI0021C33ED9|nr:response regulator [Vibrio pelagius]
MSVSNLKVLILDDSNVVISSVRGMLSRIGFSERNIAFSQSPKNGIALAKKELFDVIICDYNFYSTLDGKQVFEEMKHFDCLKSDSIFVVITGDSSLETVNSLIDLEPDDYLLKPFNQEFLRKRVISGVERKRAMKGIYIARDRGDFEIGVQECDKLLPFFPQYYNYIMKEKGRFYRLMKLWNQAKEFYKSLLNHNDSDWVVLGLSNSMKNLGELEEARKLVNSIIERSPNNINAIKEMASIDLHSNKIPDSIKNIKLVNSLTKGSSERELVISNLSLSVGDYRESFNFYKKYYNLNRDTFRDDLWMKLNLVRRMLMFFTRDSQETISLVMIESSVLELVSIEDRSESWKINVDILTSHLLLLQGKFEEFLGLLNSSYRDLLSSVNSNLFHFYDILYFVWLLSYCSYDKESQEMSVILAKSFKKSIVQNKNDINSEIILDSMKALLEQSIDLERVKRDWLDERYQVLQGLNMNESLPIYIEISQRYPTLVSVRTKIVEHLGDVWPEGLGKTQTKRLLKQSDDVVRQLSDRDYLEVIKYDCCYQKALSTISRV